MSAPVRTGENQMPMYQRKISQGKQAACDRNFRKYMAFSHFPIGTASSNQDRTLVCMLQKNSSKPCVVSTIKIYISSDPKCSVNGSNNVLLVFIEYRNGIFLFQRLFVTLLQLLILIHSNLLLCLSWFPMTSLSCDCHVTRNQAVIHPSLGS